MADNKYVFFLDIDGTFMNNGVICMKNRSAVSYARKNGHFVFINTARSYSIIPEKILKMKLDGFVTSLGCNITVAGKEIYSRSIKTEEVAEIYDYFNNSDRDIYVEGNRVLISNNKRDFSGKQTVRNGKEIIKKFSGESIAKIFIPGVLSDKEQEFLRKKYMFYQHPGYAEFCVKGNSKASGMKRVMDYLGIDIKYSVAMGDSINDIEMLEAAGTAVVMGDGADTVKSFADIITCNASDCGVAEGIYKIIGR